MEGSRFLNDLRACSFDAWLAFAFDHPAPVGKEPNWWHVSEPDEDLYLVVDPVLQLQHGCTLFLNPLVLRDRFTDAQIEQGFWFLAWSGIILCGNFFADHLWDETVPIEIRREAIEAMFDLYAKLFGPYPTENATYMWWDLLVDDVIGTHFGE